MNHKFLLVAVLSCSALLECMDKKLLFSSSPSSQIQEKRDRLELEYSPAALKKIQEQKPSSPTMKMAISEDKTKIATLDDKGLIQIWDGQSGDFLTNAGVTDQQINQLMKFNKEGTTIIMSNTGGTTEYPVQKKEQTALPITEKIGEGQPLSTQTVQSSTTVQKESPLVKESSSFGKPLSSKTLSQTQEGTSSSKTTGSEEIISSPLESKTSSTTISQPSTSSQEKSHFTPSTETMFNKKEKVILKSSSLHPTKIATLDEQGTIQVWNAYDGTLLTTLKDNYKSEKVKDLSFSFDDTVFILIESPTGTTKTIIPSQPTSVESKSSTITISPPSTSSQEKSYFTPSTATMFNKKEKIILQSSVLHPTKIATLDEQGTIQVWNSYDGTLLTTLRDNYKSERVNKLSFSDDGTILIIKNPTVTTKITVRSQPTSLESKSSTISSEQPITTSIEKSPSTPSTETVSPLESKSSTTTREQPITTSLEKSPSISSTETVSPLESKSSTITSEQPVPISLEKSPSISSSTSLEKLHTKKNIRLNSVDIKRTKVATLDEEGTIQVWNTKDGALLTKIIDYKTEKVTDLSFSKDGSLLIIETPFGIDKVMISS
ncbi:hypothetical protein H0X06_02850 [Candidatus Dependentiae bacterium]|nr:hypothetical protein [Candidatus Dependentiae bacterium]